MPRPSGSSALAGALLTYCGAHRFARRTGSRPSLRCGIVASVGVEQPRFLGWALAVAEALVAGPVEVAIVGEPIAARCRDVCLAVAPARGGCRHWANRMRQASRLLADRPLVDGRPAAYVCRGMVCDAPVTDVEALRRQLAEAAPASS